MHRPINAQNKGILCFSDFSYVVTLQLSMLKIVELSSSSSSSSSSSYYYY